MARATDLLGAGFAPAQVQAIDGGTPATALSAAGTTLATATALTSAINLVSTAAASSGVALPNPSNVGDQIVVYNDGTGNSFYVYPEVSANKINQLAAGAGFLLGNNTFATLQKVTATRWLADLSA